ncbi:hypothetical protein PV10_00435 [Exophiala mesophila]|uniref:Zn(2)-C6 fungal-type domain-containing protein n=1 Tax=Exophiala mesophila TaxID=212818 RepID=A0A0D1Y7C1_EXOME|nr:uncharacterized protein PV10_00435 [Exophiala mesophila]KIV96591.1 hypothetical protein PV10_00435 [Exophiala mesophila]
MAVDAVNPTTSSSPRPRKRKAHKKSRAGCRNCKLRRIKCDEALPTCVRCLEFAVSCNYNPKIPDLQPLEPHIRVKRTGTELIRSPVLSKQDCITMISDSLRDDQPSPGPYLNFGVDELARVHRFQTRTVLYVGSNASTHDYGTEVLRLACSHPFLMHIVLGVTASHDRHLQEHVTRAPFTVESYHLSHGIQLFHDKLSNPVVSRDRDALWVASILLGIASFSSIATRVVEEAWPLVSEDLAWLRLSEGKRVVFQLTNPARLDSTWRSSVETYVSAVSLPVRARHGDTPFDHLCEEPGPDWPTSNPYQEMVPKLAHLLNLEYGESTFLPFLSFVMHMDPHFGDAVEQRDPWAMLMLAYWFAKVCRSRWWIARRAILSGLAICVYIERNFPHDERLQAACILPRAVLERAMEAEGLKYS